MMFRDVFVFSWPRKMGTFVYDYSIYKSMVANKYETWTYYIHHVVCNARANIYTVSVYNRSSTLKMVTSGLLRPVARILKRGVTK